VRRGIIDAIVRVMVEWYERCRGIAWEWQAADTKLLAAPLGGEATGPNPTDLGKSGTKQHLLVDGRGVPLAFHLSAANRHDLKGLSHLLKPEEGVLEIRPEPTEQAPQHLCIGTRLTMPRKRIFCWKS
jgi:putative transposase